MKFNPPLKFKHKQVVVKAYRKINTFETKKVKCGKKTSLGRKGFLK